VCGLLKKIMSGKRGEGGAVGESRGRVFSYNSVLPFNLYLNIDFDMSAGLFS
jgi:hypothetical protein